MSLLQNKSSNITLFRELHYSLGLGETGASYIVERGTYMTELLQWLKHFNLHSFLSSQVSCILPLHNTTATKTQPFFFPPFFFILNKDSL